MPSEETVVSKYKYNSIHPQTKKYNSILDKSVHLLTEEDISQLTREDCRSYLEVKGMRRPSWNKGQAIQQAILLKRFYEPSPEGDSSPPLQMPCFTPLPIAPEPKSQNLQESYDREMPTVSGYPAAAATHSNSPRNNMRTGQMTIFYSGKVNVYDDIPLDKAQAILHLAASQIPLPPQEDVRAMQPGCSITKFITHSTASPTSQTVKVSAKRPWLVGEGCRSPDKYAASEGQRSRNACVERFLEKKKKDRLKRPRVMMN